jgi:hypothetical protein
LERQAAIHGKLNEIHQDLLVKPPAPQAAANHHSERVINDGIRSGPPIST